MTRPNLGGYCASRRYFWFLVLETFGTEWFMRPCVTGKNFPIFVQAMRRASTAYSCLVRQLAWTMFGSSLGPFGWSLGCSSQKFWPFTYQSMYSNNQYSISPSNHTAKHLYKTLVQPRLVSKRFWRFTSKLYILPLNTILVILWLNNLITNMLGSNWIQPFWGFNNIPSLGNIVLEWHFTKHFSKGPTLE